MMRIAALLVLMAGLLAGCGGAAPTLQPTTLPIPTNALPSATPAPTVTPTPSPAPIPTAGPLSGLPADPALLALPPIAVVIPSDSPQYGLSRASVVYVAPTEGGIPRFMALFEGVAADRIGPVRSARPCFVEWACPYGPLFVHWGGSPQALQLLADMECIRPLDGLTYGSAYFRHEPDPQVPWNSEFTTGDLLYSYMRNWEIARTVGYQGYAHAPCLHAELPLTHTIELSPGASVVRYTYSPFGDAYARAWGGRPHLDALTGRQIAPNNLAVIFVPQQPLAGDPAGRLEIVTSGAGEAVVFACGGEIRGRWAKESPQAELRFLDERGQEIAFAPGSLWIEVLAPGTPVRVEWRP